MLIRKSLSILWLTVTFAVVFQSSSTFAQSGAGQISGVVVDSSGAVIPGAKVVTVNPATGTKRHSESDGQGRFLFVNLLPTAYMIYVSAPGFAVNEVRNILLTAGESRVVTCILQPEAVNNEITVQSGTVGIDLSSARMGGNVQAEQVKNMPLNGRQLSQLYLLAPGAQTAGGGSYDNIRFSGRANQQNAIRHDGVEGSAIVDASPGNLNGETSSGFRLQTSLETVQEFRVESSNYPAEYGTGTGGQISVVTKSGTNDQHGSLFEYLRNGNLDARNFFDAGKSTLRMNQFGGSLGGAIKKNKLFYFASFEALRQRAAVNIIEAVPSTLAKTRAVPSIRPLLDAYPAGMPTSNPDLDLAQLRASTPIDENFGSMRLDYAINSKYSLTARYSRDQGELIQPLSVTGNYARTTAVPQNGMVAFQQILKSTVVNQITLGYNGAKTRLNGVAPSVNGLDLSAVSIDFTGTATIAGVGGQGTSGGAARIGGLVRSSSAQNGRAQPYTAYTFTFADSLSWIHGAHSFKFGVEVRPVRVYTDRLGGPTYAFSNVTSLLNNAPSSVSVLGDVSAPNPLHNGATGNRFLRQAYYIGFVQDEWKLSRTLTMNMGLRYEYYSPMSEARGLFTYFNMNTGQLDLGPDQQWYQSRKTNFGPRLSFAWSPSRFNGNTVFRVGAGFYYGPGQTEDQVQMIDSDRVTVTQTNSIAFPVNAQAIINTFDVKNFTNFAPRVYAPGYALPEKVLSYTASIQQRLRFDTVLTVAYVGSQGRNLFLRSWTNGIVGINMNPATGAGLPILEYGSRFAQMDYKTSGGTDHYDSMQTTLNRRFAHGLTIGTQWTWGHSLGNTGGSNEAQTAQNPFNFEYDRGNNAFDVRHSVNATALYELPFGKVLNSPHALRLLVGGWQVGGIVNARTGLPIDLTIARNDLAYRVNATGQIVDQPIVTGAQIMTTPVVNNPCGGAFRSNRRPSVVGGVNPYLASSTDKRVFLNPAAFTFPQPGEFGNLGRWALHGPGLSQVDFTVHKRIFITEKVGFEFRAEIYNVMNRANFANPVSRLNNALGVNANQIQPGQPFTQAAAGGSFGLMTSTVTKDVGLGASRQVQFSLRLSF